MTRRPLRCDVGLVARGKRGLTLSGHTISKSNRLPSKGSDPFYHGLLVFIVLLNCSSLVASEPSEARRISKLETVPPNTWVKLHEQSSADETRFRRQEHGGSCFDSKRGRIILFGSNTHGKDWTNSPLIFDLAENRWSRLYPDDDRATYRANDEGLPVAGLQGDHPWAMHTFGSVVYDPVRDEMVVCCNDPHMVPGRFTDALKGVWETVKRHPTWAFRLSDNRWEPLPCPAVHFFPYAATWDSDRKMIVGYGNGVWELQGSPRQWNKVFDKALCGWHNNVVYDSRHKAFVVFGSNENSNDIIIYRPESGEHRKLPTVGKRPPKDQHNPMCYEPTIGRTLVLVDHVRDGESPAMGSTESWLFDLATDSWQHLPTASLPFVCGMNYNCHYDPVSRACLLVADVPSPQGKIVTVFAIRLSVP